MEEGFVWRLSMSGDSLDYDDLPVNGLPQELDTARKVKTTLEKIQQLPPDIMWSLPAVSISKLAGRIIALSACPQGLACFTCRIFLNYVYIYRLGRCQP